MVPMNPFVGKEQRHRCREWTCGHRWGRSGGKKEQKASKRKFSKFKLKTKKGINPTLPWIKRANKK